MIQFRQFLDHKIQYLISHFRKNCVLLDYNGNQIREIDLSFDSLSDEYITFCQQQQRKLRSQKIIQNIDSRSEQIPQMHSLKINQTQLDIKLNDKDLRDFWASVNPTYELAFNLENQDVSDQSILALSQLYQQQMCKFTRLKLKGNSKITQVGLMKLGQALRDNQCIKEINLNGLQVGSNGLNRIIELIGVTHVEILDLGLIGNDSLKYLAKNLQNPHHLNSIWFGENTQHKWQEEGKQAFQKVMRKCEFSKRILSINVYPLQPMQHYSFISELNIVTRKNRTSRIDQRQNEFKSASLNPQHHGYYDPDNHNLNAYKFSVKSYLTNVFGSLLDEALYFLQKERRNQLRDEATFEITNEPTNKVILQDICTADGSIIVLTKYLLGKIKEKEKQQNTGPSY